MIEVINYQEAFFEPEDTRNMGIKDVLRITRQSEHFQHVLNKTQVF